MSIRKIISGGQTGSDRGALDAAHAIGIDRGGWAPKGWRAEDGIIPNFYRVGMRESHARAYPVRTRQNIEDSDGTLILSLGELPVDGGSTLTCKLARLHWKAYRHVIIPADGNIYGIALERTCNWMRDSQIRVLNVAGPRESREPGLQAAARKALVIIMTVLRLDDTR
jgi:hypothetical protein